MRMSVAGATGAIRRPLFTTLIAARREVVGMTSSARGLIALQKYGADGDDSRCVPLASSWANTIVGLVKDYGNRYQAFRLPSISTASRSLLWENPGFSLRICTSRAILRRSRRNEDATGCDGAIICPQPAAS